jgi:hypothetical protein
MALLLHDDPVPGVSGARWTMPMLVKALGAWPERGVDAERPAGPATAGSWSLFATRMP